MFCSCGPGGAGAGAGWDREGREERVAHPQQPAGEQGDATGGWEVHHGTSEIRQIANGRQVLIL